MRTRSRLAAGLRAACRRTALAWLALVFVLTLYLLGGLQPLDNMLGDPTVRALGRGEALQSLGFWPLVALSLALLHLLAGRFSEWSRPAGALLAAAWIVAILLGSLFLQSVVNVVLDPAAPSLFLVLLYLEGQLRPSRQGDGRIDGNGFDALLVFDRQGSVTAVNSSAETLLDRSRAALVGRRLLQLFAPGVGGKSDAEALSMVAAEGVPSSAVMHRGDGHELPVRLAVSEFAAGSEPRFLAFVRDKVDLARSPLQEAIDCIGEGFALYDAEDRLVLCNSTFKVMLEPVESLLQPGWRFEDTIRAAAELGWIPAAVGRVDDWLAERMACRLNPKDPFELALADGRHLMISERRTHDGGIVGIYSDITEMKQRQDGLEQATRVAEAASQSKSEFLANMSHELRTPLNAIIGFSEIIDGEALGPVGTPQYKEYAGDIKESGLHLLGIVNDILDVSKIEAGEYKLTEEEMDLCEIVRASVRIVRLRAEEAGHELIVDVPENPLIVVADQRSIKQILINLIGNAIKFTPEGGRIVVAVDLNAERSLQLKVRDNGIGIAEEDIPKALAFFGQVDSKLARAYEGTGLGLPLARNLIELQGGSLELTSGLGQGTCVTISFPADRVVDTGGLERTRPLAV